MTNRNHPDLLLVGSLKTKFSLLYCPSQTISVDECMIPYRSRRSCECYDPSKPIKWGIKVWMACDAKSGYAYNLDVYSATEKDFVELNTVNSY